MGNRRIAWTAALALALSAAAPAQKVALGDRMVQLLDCSRLGDGVSLEGLARIVQALAEPALPAANVTPLGPAHIAVLGTPQQCAGAERVFAKAIEQLGVALYVDCKILQLDAGLFAQHVEPLLPKAPAAAQVVLTERAIGDLIAALRAAKGLAILQAPKIVVPLLHEASLRVGTERRYVADAQLEANEGADGRWGIGAIDGTVFDGSQLRVVGTRRGDGESLVHLRAEHAAFPAKLPEVEVELAHGIRSKIQVPHGTTCSIDVCAAVRDGEVLLATAPLRDGTFVCWLLQVHAIKPGR